MVPRAYRIQHNNIMGLGIRPAVHARELQMKAHGHAVLYINTLDLPSTGNRDGSYTRAWGERQVFLGLREGQPRRRRFATKPFFAVQRTGCTMLLCIPGKKPDFQKHQKPTDGLSTPEGSAQTLKIAGSTSKREQWRRHRSALTHLSVGAACRVVMS